MSRDIHVVATARMGELRVRSSVHRSDADMMQG